MQKKNLKEFDDLKIPYIYNNGRRKQGDTLNITIDINVNTEDRIKISTESDEEHIVLCLSNLKVTDLAQSEAMVGYFNLLLEKNKMAINNTQQILNFNQKKIDDNKRIEEITQLKIKQAEQTSLELKSAHQSFTAVYTQDKDSFIKQIEKEYEKVRSLVSDNTFNSTCELSKILTNHKIESEVFKNIFVIRNRLINLNATEQPNMKLLLSWNVEIDHLVAPTSN